MKRPRILGIVNVTRDSFSDGGKFLDPTAALEHARRLLADGADIIDVGAESTHPDAELVPPQEEIRRLTPVIERLKADRVVVSVDTHKPAVMRQVLGLGADYINDVTALAAPGALEAVRQSSCGLILMHAVREDAATDARAVRSDVDSGSMISRILAFFQRRLVELDAAGIARGRLIFDPGMGMFLGRQAEASLAVLRGLPQLRTLGRPLLVSVSRKSFVGAVVAGSAMARCADQRSAGTLAAELWAALRGADYIRTHEPGPLRDALRMWSALDPSAFP